MKCPFKLVPFQGTCLFLGGGYFVALGLLFSHQRPLPLNETPKKFFFVNIKTSKENNTKPLPQKKQRTNDDYVPKTNENRLSAPWHQPRCRQGLSARERLGSFEPKFKVKDSEATSFQPESGSRL